MAGRVPSLVKFVLAAAAAVGGYHLLGRTGHVAPASADAAELPLHLAVVCDASDSGATRSCTREGLGEVLALWSRAALERPGSTFTVTLAGRSVDTAQEALSITVPDRWGAGVRAAKTRFLADSRARVREVVFEAGGSAVAEAIFVAQRRLGGRTGVHRLLIMSDLRQVTPGRWNFERRVPPPARFARWVRTQALVADLSGVPVSVCGVHLGRAPRGPRHSAVRDGDIRAAWTAAFEAMRAPQVPMAMACDASALGAAIPGSGA